MASRSSVRVVVYDTRIQGMNVPGGEVNNYVRRKVGLTAVLAQEKAPVRTGRLKAGIRTDVRTVRNGTVGRVRSTAKHSLWVHEGTTGPIFGNAGFLWVPSSKYGTRRVRRSEVAGQRANPFLAEALDVVMGARGALSRPSLLGSFSF